MNTAPKLQTTDRRYWQEGIAGLCNIVTFDGEDVRGIAYVGDSVLRAALIRKQNETMRLALAPPSGEGVDELQFYRNECALYRQKIDLIMAEIAECDEQGRAFINTGTIAEIITHEPGREHDE